MLRFKIKIRGFVPEINNTQGAKVINIGALKPVFSEINRFDVLFSFLSMAKLPTSAEGVSLVLPKVSSVTLMTNVLNRTPAVIFQSGRSNVCILKAAMLVILAPSGYKPRFESDCVS